MRYLVGALSLALSIAGCSASGGDDSDGRTGDGSSHSNKTGGSGGGAAGTGAPSAFDVGNNMKVPSVVQTPVDMGQFIDGGLCEVGKFCEPTTADGECGSVTLMSNVKTIMHPGNVLLIFDRSFSMSMDWNGMPRWQGAGNALINALTPLADLLTIGGVMYPSETPGPDDIGLSCAVDPFGSPEQLAFQPAPMALAALQAPPPSGNPTPLYGPVGAGPMDAALGATPTSEAIAAADVAFRGATLMGTTVAVVITDGEPNCAWDQNATTGIVSKWVTDLGIKTYVVGLPGIAGMGGGPGGGPPGGGNGPAVLNAIAQAGGTDQYIDAADPMTLQTKLGDIVSSTVSSGFDSCGMDLDPAADPADKLQLVVSEKGVDENVLHDLGNGGGWTVTPDGRHVELMGSLCDDAMGGRFETVKFEYGCMELPPLPPEPVPD